MRDVKWKFLLLFLQQVNAQTGCVLFNHDCDNWKFIIKVNEACMTFHDVKSVTEWRLNSVDAASAGAGCKFDTTLVNGEYTLEFDVDACGNAESMSKDGAHKIWTAVIDNKDTNAGIYTSQKISQAFSCKYNKDHVVVSDELAVSSAELDVGTSSDDDVQTDDLYAPLYLYDRNLTCFNQSCTEAPRPGILITENYTVRIGLDVRLQFELSLDHKLDFCKVSDSDPDGETPPTEDHFILKDGCLHDLGRRDAPINEQWIEKNQTDLQFKAFAFNEGGDVYFKCQLHLCAGSYCDMPTFDECGNGQGNEYLFDEYLKVGARSLEMLDRKRRTIEITGRIPRVERQADENSVAENEGQQGPNAASGSASMSPVTAGGKKVSNKGVTMIVAGDMAYQFDTYKPKLVSNYYGHETSRSSPLASSIFCLLVVVITQFL